LLKVIEIQITFPTHYFISAKCDEKVAHVGKFTYLFTLTTVIAVTTHESRRWNFSQIEIPMAEFKVLTAQGQNSKMYL